MHSRHPYEVCLISPSGTLLIHPTRQRVLSRTLVWLPTLHDMFVR